MSYNIPAIRALEALGPRVGASYAERMGISTLHPNEVDNLSLTLGGLTNGVSALDMAQAYSVFANQGVRLDLHSVERIVDRHGDVIYEYKVDPKQVLSPQAAFLVNDILQDFVTNYLGRALQIDRPVAAKTGTTENWRDVYLVAYTPNLVASFWMGYDEPKLGRIQQGWRYSTAFLREVFLEAFEDLEVVDFERPDGIVSVSVCSRSGLLPNDSCSAAGTVVSDYFIASQAPGETCNMHTGMFYNRPPYITTDERWSSRGGPGRGPEDAKEMPPGGITDMFEQPGMTTNEISLFNAVVVPDGVTLQWQYNGPPVAGFILTRDIQGPDSSSQTVELDKSTRQYSDTAIEAEGFLTYTLAALYDDGNLSDSATVVINKTSAPGGGGIITAPDELTPVVVPNFVGTFQAIAEMDISRLGLRIGTVTEDYQPDQPRRIVVSQFPEAGSTVMKGSYINLVVTTRTETE